MKTYVFDASAVIAFLGRKPGAVKVSEILKQALHGHAHVLLSAANYGEVYSHVRRLHGIPEAQDTVNKIASLGIEVVDLTPQRAIHAAEMKAKYRLYYIDSCAAALALEHKATLVTSDSDFRKLGHGFPLLWLKA